VVADVPSFRRILVPLDGSALAEAILPAACVLSGQLGSEVALLHVVEREPPATVHGEPHLGGHDEAVAYLEARAQGLREQGVPVTVHVHERPVADVAIAIDYHAHELEADLIAMCAHGRTNLRTRLMGSIAERILRGGSVPILLRTVREPEAGAFGLHTVLVPIDFGHDVEAATTAARTLATPAHANVVLLSALEPREAATSRLLPGTAALAREFDLEHLGRNLDRLAIPLRDAGLDVRTIVDDRRPADAILAAADELAADVIVLVTDAHGGLSSWYEPSTGRRLLERPRLTLLLIKEL
jgi:nucleotide-binding universal stress UspA family protein